MNINDSKWSGLRPLVRKHFPYFLNCVKHYGAETVRGVLKNGKHGKVRLTFMHNKKDRYQMMQMLDLV